MHLGFVQTFSPPVLKDPIKIVLGPLIEKQFIELSKGK
jgi:hypothetical protein